MFLATLDAKKGFWCCEPWDHLKEYILWTALLAMNGSSWETCTSTLLPVSSGRGNFQRSSPLHQGVIQGGILSICHYKRYNNSLLLVLQEQLTGINTGNIKYPHTTCADDVALISSSHDELRSMLLTHWRTSVKPMQVFHQSGEKKRPGLQS